MTPCNSLGRGLLEHAMGQKEAVQGLLPAARPSLRAGNNNRLSCLLKPCKEQVKHLSFPGENKKLDTSDCDGKHVYISLYSV